MMCYRDMTFCQSKCSNTECSRHWDAEKQAAADRWWGKPGAPVAFSDFSTDCDKFIDAAINEQKEEA